MKMAVIGDMDFVTGFMLAGIVDIYEVSRDEEIFKAVEDVLRREDIGVVAIKHEFLKKLPVALRKEIDERVQPTFIAVGATGGVEEIKEKIRKAIGVELWK